MGVCNAAHAAGIDVPGQLTVVGFDDIPMAAWDLVHLTTVRSDLAAMARAAASLITGRIASPAAPRRTVRMPVEIVLRGTHAPPRTSSQALPRTSARTASG
jgi:LacI family transcriptional regulator